MFDLSSSEIADARREAMSSSRRRGHFINLASQLFAVPFAVVLWFHLQTLKAAVDFSNGTRTGLHD
jgi:hypothetical protein